jgi:hypothetical protein
LEAESRRLPREIAHEFKEIGFGVCEGFVHGHLGLRTLCAMVGTEVVGEEGYLPHLLNLRACSTSRESKRAER